MFNTDYLDNIFYIYPTREDAEKGSDVGASGFYVMVESEVIRRGQVHIYGVTNAHVIEQIEQGADGDIVYVRTNLKEGGLKIDEVKIAQWERHPDGDDLAVYAWKPEFPLNIRAFDVEDFISWDLMQRHGIGVGDHTTTVGRYNLHPGKLSNRPAARFGRVSMLPHEPVRQSTRNSFEQESFLVETYSINGFSGSPVYLTVKADGRVNAPEPLQEGRTFLLGVDWGHFDFDGVVRTDPFTGRIHTPSGMMCVVPAWKLKDILYSEDFVKKRALIDNKINSVLT